MKYKKFTEDELIDKIMQFPPEYLLNLIKKYNIDIGGEWAPPYIDEEKFYFAHMIVENISKDLLIKELGKLLK